MAGKLKVQVFRANDLSQNTGKQFELGKSWCEDFFEIDNSITEYSILLEFKPLSYAYIPLKGKEIELKLSEVTGRGDRKAYANGGFGHSQIKEFFIDNLKLTDDNLNDYFAIYKTDLNKYYLYYVPKLLYDNFICLFKEENLGVSMICEAKDTSISEDKTLQQIFYGALGTGKSNTIKKETANAEKDERVIRTTFHPDSDYSTFVGAYKPTMKESLITKDGVTTKEEKIIYTFCPQAFTNAYVKAWNTEENVYLIIEEINRGNCAQIFGDLFQLLDRKNGMSEYPIEADADLQNYLQKALADTTRDIPEDVKMGRKLMLPNNLYIWATMNTSDQSLFPIDSAFKRRWEWKYIKIKEGRDGNGSKLDWKVDIKIDEESNQLSWWEFVKKINEIIASMTSSADKQLGYFFCCAKDGVIDESTFVSKVIFYLWNGVFKDYGFEDVSLFRYADKEGEHDLTFPDFYDEDGEKVNTERLTDFVKKVMSWKNTSEGNV